MHVDRRTALVTGSTDGHGRLVALGLAERGWRVLFHGRDAARGGQALAEAGEDGHELLLADLASLAEVRRLAAEVAERLAEPLSARGITIDAVHPATLMDTTLVRENLGRVYSTVEDGASATLRLIEDDGGTGRFFDGIEESEAIPAAYDPAERERIRQLTARFLR